MQQRLKITVIIIIMSLVITRRRGNTALVSNRNSLNFWRKGGFLALVGSLCKDCVSIKMPVWGILDPKTNPQFVSELYPEITQKIETLVLQFFCQESNARK